MNKLLFILLFVVFNASAGLGYKSCAKWDSMCKNPAEIVATKCRLGVQVNKAQCESLGMNDNFYFFSNGSLEGLPVSTINGNPTTEILKDYL